MSFYGAKLAAAVQKTYGYCPPPPQKPGFWDTWKGVVTVFLVTLAILVGVLFYFAPQK